MSEELNHPVRSQREAELQRQCSLLNWQVGVAINALRTISRECAHVEMQDLATAALTKITKDTR